MVSRIAFHSQSRYVNKFLKIKIFLIHFSLSQHEYFKSLFLWVPSTSFVDSLTLYFTLLYVVDDDDGDDDVWRIERDREREDCWVREL